MFEWERIYWAACLIATLILEILQVVVKFLTPTKFLSKKDLSSEIALVTGAGSGIGRETALALAKTGCRLVLWDVNEAGNEETKAIIQRDGGKTPLTYTVDVTNVDAIHSTAKKIETDVGPVTILVNNAGIATVNGYLNRPDEAIRKTVEVNLLSQLLITKTLLPSMLDNNHGHIVNIASIAGLIGLPGLVDYCASKYGSVGITDCLAMELAYMNKDIKTTKVCLGVVDTPLTTEFSTIAAPKDKRGTNEGFLEPKYVGEKIVEAIQTDQSFLLLPLQLYLFVALKPFVPTKRYAALLKSFVWDTSELLTYKNKT